MRACKSEEKGSAILAALLALRPQVGAIFRGTWYRAYLQESFPFQIFGKQTTFARATTVAMTGACTLVYLRNPTL